jgi:TPR repeat protein
MRNLIKTFVLFLMLSFSHAAIAGDLEDGITAEQKSVVATALRLWTPLAEQGDASAQFYLGIAYDQGLGVAQDYNTAVKWYTLAAEQGYADAQYNLGNMYSKGLRVEHDYKTAIKWYTLSAEQGHTKAQLMLGFGYALGQGVAQDYVKAHMWWNIAAIEGNVDAIWNRDFVAKKMSSTQIEKAQEAASRCIKQNFKNCD